MIYRLIAICWMIIAILSMAASAQESTKGSLTIHMDQPGIHISPTLYGLMTEEINHSYDGGLYAELVQNRDLKQSERDPLHWSLVSGQSHSAVMSVDLQNPVPNTVLTSSLRLDVKEGDGQSRVGVANDGYWGIPAHENEEYRGSFYAKAGPEDVGPVTIDIESEDGADTIATTEVRGVTADWQKYNFTLKSGRITPSNKNRLVISIKHPGTLWLTQVSLFPPTFDNRPNGNRGDLMTLLGEMKPAFLRFPGGNYLEGGSIEDRFAWEKTVGPIEQRPGHMGIWSGRSTDGMGLLEFCEWCEDLHMEPLLAVYAGYSIPNQHIEPGPTLAPYVDEAIEEIEYVMGDGSTKGGALRIKDGHPAPFPLHYVEIGNEDGFDGSGSYEGRFAQFHDAIKSRFPDLQLIATESVRNSTPDLVDEHFYQSARDSALDASRYDNHTRTGPKIFVGEWASVEGTPTPNFEAALGDASWLTGLERNSDLVVMSSYAPLLTNANPGASQWHTNLVGYDGQTVFGSPSYYVQKMFSQNRGDRVLPVAIIQPHHTPSAPVPEKGATGFGTWATSAEFKDIQVTDSQGRILNDLGLMDSLTGWEVHDGNWSAANGSLTQADANPLGCHTIRGDRGWSDYTLHLKARKVSGNEGFLIMFHYQDEKNWTWWNIGGWGNHGSALEKMKDGEKFGIGHGQDLSVETNRWYDIRIELSGVHIKCYLDDKLQIETDDVPPAAPPALYATASTVDSTGEVILKLVNYSPYPENVDTDFLGGTDDTLSGQMTILHCSDLKAQNSCVEPTKIAPIVRPINQLPVSSSLRIPAYSIIVLRLKGGAPAAMVAPTPTPVAMANAIEDTDEYKILKPQ